MKLKTHIIKIAINKKKNMNLCKREIIYKLSPK